MNRVNGDNILVIDKSGQKHVVGDSGELSKPKTKTEVNLDFLNGLLERLKKKSDKEDAGSDDEVE
eukprot:CAMPEP_0168628178 /NCGR_PEP_ID=MMETSP0449_2-20121227/11701_1 /TAXON_ID=1082188 /ORGANISM="Strombidium rassoulzadegani, Strain ras09" /LENGTH=64 /DNA_ID=CAMNT_0008670571 /DNA_START=98 /DNA_END=292 /DNA_ORIENTATION=-